MTSVSVVIGQAETPAKCPSISITGPAGIVQPGDLLRFTVSIHSENTTQNLAFEWNVEAGAIVSGQGTKTLEVKPEKYYNKTTIATVSVTGLPDGCPKTASESGGTVCDSYLIVGDASLWTQYSKFSWAEERSELDAIVRNGLTRYPDRVIYLEKTFEEHLPQKNVDARVRQIKTHLRKAKKLPNDRIFIRLFRGNRDRTTAYLVPFNAPVLDPNYSDPCQQ